MKLVLIDTDILSLFFRGDPNVVACFDDYIAEHDHVNISILTYYEIVSGLKHEDAHQQLSTFLKFSSQSNIVPLTEPSVTLSAEIYADLRAKGMPLDDIDLLIAGSALANDWILVTHNTKHFDRIEGLQIEDWAEV